MAVTKYLDKTGLTYFWNKIKAWCNSLFALDSSVVHKTGDETISGLKTFTHSVFSDGYIGSIRNDPACELYFKDYIKGNSVSERMLSGMFIHDQTGAAFGASSRLAAVIGAVNTDKSTEVILAAYKNVANSVFANSLRIICNEDGTGYALCPTPSSLSDSSNKISTTEWVQNNLAYYPYISEPINSSGYKHWSFNNIADDTIVGFDGFIVTGKYHIRFSSSTYNAPVSPSAYTDGILIVDTTNAASKVSSHYRVVQTFILNGYQNRPIIYRRLGATSSDENAVNGLIFNSWHCDSGGTLDVSTTGNAATATKLATARTINGVSFDGSANITVADDTKVSKTGNETIAGVKTFTDDPVISNATSILQLKNTEDTSYEDIRFSDSTGRNQSAIRSFIGSGALQIGNAYNKGVWYTGASLEFSNSGNFTLSAKTDLAESKLVGLASGSLTWSGTAPSASDDSTKIATTEWVRDATGNFACNAATATKLATARTINGVSFDGSANITVADSTKLPLTGGTLTGNITIKNNNATKGTAPSSTAERIVRFYDSADHKMGALSTAYYTDKSSKVAIYAYNTSVASSESNIGYIAVGSNADGSVYTYAPNPASSSNDNSIATTKWVSDSCVKVSGDQTVAGTKTFSSTVLSTGIAGKGGDSGDCYLSGQPDSGKGAWIAVYGKTRSQIPGYVRIQARTENNGKTLQCKPNGDLTWDGNAIQVSSDERIKTRLESVSDDVLDNWDNVKWGQFKLLESVEAKGEKARHHVGLIAQQVNQAFSKSETSILDYGILCYEQDDLFDLWTVRYTEALCMEAAYQRRKNKILENRISELEKQVSDMIILLQNLTNGNG